MSTLWKLGGLSWKQLARRVWTEIAKDDVFGRSAQLAYYFLLALIPLLIFLTSAIGLIIGAGTGLRHALFNYMAHVMPSSAFQLIDATISELSQASSGSKVSIGILAALWAASSGMGAITDALNVAYGVKETRSWWKRRLLALGLTIALCVLITGALVLVLGGGRIAAYLAETYGLGTFFILTWRIAQWPIVLTFMFSAFALIYYFAPDLREQKFIFLTPGSVIGVALWLLVSFGFRAYLHFFDSYSKTYGSLGAVIVLMLWLYLTGTAVLIGGEINSEIENAAARLQVSDAKKKGEKKPQQRDNRAKAA